MARIALLGLACLTLTACTTDDEETAEVCTNSIVENFPNIDATGVYYRTTIEAVFAKAEESATLTVDGVNGSSTWVDNRMVFTPAQPLEPSKSYTVTVDYSCGTPSWGFTTSPVGQPVTGDIAGNAYVLKLDSARFVKPAGVGALLGQYLTTDILIGVDSLEGSDMIMVGAIGLDGADPATQDTCQPSIVFPSAATFEDPYFSVGPADTTLNVQDIEINLQDLFISGSFSPDASSIEGAVLEGAADARDFQDLIDEGDICTLAEAIGIACEECASDGEIQCLSIKVDSISAPAIPDSIEDIPDPCLREECAADPDCAAQ